MHVGVLLGVSLCEPVKYCFRLLRRCGVVEINERLAIDTHRQRRKIRPDLIDVVGAVADRRMHGHCPRLSSHTAAALSSASRIPSFAISSIASPTKAWINSASASLSGMPRDIS